MNAKEAREIREQFKDALYILEDIHPNTKAYFIAEGYLAALEGPEVNALVEGLEKLKDGHETCQRCEGDGRLWADGKSHFQSYQGKTIPCGDCAGNGETVADQREIASEALSQFREAVKK